MAMADPSPRCGFIHQILGGLILAMDSNGENYSLIWASYGFIIWNPPFHSPKHHVMPLITEKSPMEIKSPSKHDSTSMKISKSPWNFLVTPPFSIIFLGKILPGNLLIPWLATRHASLPSGTKFQRRMRTRSFSRLVARPPRHGTVNLEWQCLVNFHFRNPEPWLDEENDDKWWYYSMMIIFFGFFWIMIEMMIDLLVHLFLIPLYSLHRDQSVLSVYIFSRCFLNLRYVDNVYLGTDWYLWVHLDILRVCYIMSSLETRWFRTL